MITKKLVNTKNKVHHLVVGEAAEDLARDFLLKKDLQLLERQYRTPMGEIDLIMQDGMEIVFVEVRFREKNDPIDPLETITIHKQRRIIRTALSYLQHRHWTDDFSKRFDVISILGDELTPKITWISDAFSVK